MTDLLAQLAPQRSTQYTDLAHALALPEWQLSTPGKQGVEARLVTLGEQSYIRCTLPAALTPGQQHELGTLAMTSAFFLCYDRIGERVGPFLQPLTTGFQPALSPDLIATRRYRGKTNELFTHFLCNVARFSSDFAAQPWSKLALLDPLMGGGTTLFTGLMLGAEVAGVELNEQDVRSTATFLQQYLQHERISHKMQPERLKRLGLRWRFAIGKKEPLRCTMANGDTRESEALLPGFKPHLVVADLPYGIQHQGQLLALLQEALPVWLNMLRIGGAMALAWDATRFTRDEMTATLESHVPAEISAPVFTEPPYNALAHRVDRVIKARDVVVLKRLR
ncbi:MAG: hypothetical protein R3C14_01310 [Caldilineaceae bacterium]